MRLMRKILMPLIFLAVLGACESAEERAEGHFSAAQELLAEGDVDRAMVELRNVFKLNGRHREARKIYAAVERERGREDTAFQQYVRLVEQYPDDLDGLRALSEISLSRQDWENAERYIPRGYALAPEDLSFQSMDRLIAYRDARTAEDTEAMAEAVQAARDIVAEDGSQLFARQILIDHMVATRDLTGALEQIEISLRDDSANLRLHEMKLRVLNELQETDAVAAHLETMIRQFPENRQIQQLLISWYIQEDRLDDAESFLRDLARDAPEADRRAAQLTIMQFLQSTQGVEAALAEIEARIAAGEDAAFYRSMRAVYLFDQGERDTAISELRNVVEENPPSDDTRNSKVALARMLAATDDNVGARALIEEVLAEDASHVEALQMKAGWYIENDRPGDAIQLLRDALDQEPRNAQTLTLMAQAHLRDGSRSLAGERLALAVEVSGSAPAEAIRYANFLLEDGRFAPAESVLIDALRRAPGDVRVLQALGLAYLSQADWGRTEGVIRQLEGLETTQATAVATALQAELVLRQNNTEESIAFLQNLIDEGRASLETAALVVQTYLREGRLAEAQAYLDGIIEEHPDESSLRSIQAALQVAAGDLDSARATYEALIAEQPQNDAPVLALFVMLRDSGEAEAADAVLDAALARPAPSPRLRAAKAAQLELAGDFDGAIEIYEGLYAENTGNVVLANNLASLITTHRDDAESLERAHAIARRLQGTDVPAMQDTYGWIQYRRGNFGEAVEYLEPAAAGLPGDPMVQAHLGLAYAANDQVALARETLTRALEMAGDSPLPRYAEAREVLAGLPEAPPAPAAD